MRDPDEDSPGEARATVVRVFQSLMVPALLQTKEYARGVEPDDTALERLFRRQRVLLDGAKQFHFVIAEEALRRAACHAVSMAVQMRYLSSMSRLANVKLGIIRDGVGATGAPCACFVVLDDHVVMTDDTEHDVLADDPDDVGRYREAFTALERVARYQAEARALLAAVEADYNRPSPLISQVGSGSSMPELPLQ